MATYDIVTVGGGVGVGPGQSDGRAAVSWYTQLFLQPGSEADALRARVPPQLESDPLFLPDTLIAGPDLARPTEEYQARKFGERTGQEPPRSGVSWLNRRPVHPILARKRRLIARVRRTRERAPACVSAINSLKRPDADPRVRWCRRGTPRITHHDADRSARRRPVLRADKHDEGIRGSRRPRPASNNERWRPL